MLIKADSIGFAYPDGPMLFESIDIEVSEGDLLAIRGPSGSGKTTLLSILAGQSAPTLGEVTHSPEMDSVAWVFQSPIYVAARRVDDQVGAPGLARGESRVHARGRARQALARFELESRADARFGDLSGGERQRAALAQALLTVAPVVLIDEPTAQLDRASASLVHSTIREVAASGKAVVVASHDDGIIDAADDVLILGA